MARNDRTFAALLTATHYALDDGDLNEACRLMYRARAMYIDGFGTAADVAWMKDLDFLLHACLGSM